MSALPSSVSAQVQRCAQDISARLAQLAKDPPDLASYLRVHADCIFQALKPRGLSYEMVSGQGFQRVLTVNAEDLNYRAKPEQEYAFQKALRVVVERNAPVMLEANTLPSEGLHGMKVEDAPAPEQLPIFNATAYQQLFVPIQLSKKVVGVLQVWFAPADAITTQTRIALLTMICSEVELYLKTRRISDISQEITRLTTYSRFLEEVAGEMDLETVAWNIVNYAREAVGCERVCLLTARNYGQAAFRKRSLSETEFNLQACSGVKRPHPRSEQAEILKDHSRELLFLALPELVQPEAKHGANGSHEGNGTGGTATDSAPQSRQKEPRAAITEIESSSSDSAALLGEAETEEQPPTSENLPAKTQSVSPMMAGSERPQIRLVLTERDPSKVESRPEPVNRYFEMVPMNWSTVLPLFDRSNRVCGILLFEGVRQGDNLQSSFLQMRDLAVSGGRALGTSLFWHQRRSLRVAKNWIQVKESYTNTPRKRLFAKVVLPVVLIAGFLSIPMPFQVKGEAVVQPVNYLAMPALVSGRLLDVYVQEGSLVQAGDPLCRIDSQDLELQLRQSRQEYERAMAEADIALSAGSEPQMQLARLTAQKAATLAEKLQKDIENSTLRAPFAGVVLGPQNLSQKRGTVVRVGDTVLELADPSAWQVRLRVREQDLAYLERLLRETPSIPGKLRLASNPTEAHPIEVTDPSQFAYGLDTVHGQYSFSIVLPLQLAHASEDLLKAGFAGRASLGTEYKPMAYILFRDFINFLKVRWI